MSILHALYIYSPSIIGYDCMSAGSWFKNISVIFASIDGAAQQ